MEQLSRLEKLEQQKRDIERKINEIKAKQNAAERKLETRKKVLLGALIMQQINDGKISQNDILAQLNDFLIRDADRQLFGLSPKVKD